MTAPTAADASRRRPPVVLHIAPDSAHGEGHAGGPDGQAPLHASRRRPRVVLHIVHRSVSHAFVEELGGEPVGPALRGLAQSVTLAGAAGARLVELALWVLSQRPAAPGGGGDPPPPGTPLLELDDKALRLLTHRCFSYTTQGSTGARKKVTDYPDDAWQAIVAAWERALAAGRGPGVALVPGGMSRAVQYAADRYLVGLKTHCVGGVLAHAKRLLPVLHAATKAEVTRALALFAPPSVWADDAHDNDEEEEEASCAVEEEEKGGDAAGAGGAPDGDDAAADAEWTTASQKLCDHARLVTDADLRAALDAASTRSAEETIALVRELVSVREDDQRKLRGRFRVRLQWSLRPDDGHLQRLRALFILQREGRRWCDLIQRL